MEEGRKKKDKVRLRRTRNVRRYRSAKGEVNPGIHSQGMRTFLTEGNTAPTGGQGAEKYCSGTRKITLNTEIRKKIPGKRETKGKLEASVD